MRAAIWTAVAFCALPLTVPSATASPLHLAPCALDVPAKTGLGERVACLKAALDADVLASFPYDLVRHWGEVLAVDGNRVDGLPFGAYVSALARAHRPGAATVDPDVATDASRIDADTTGDSTAAEELVNGSPNDIAIDPRLQAAVPEPGTLLLIAMGALGALRRRRESRRGDPRY